MANRFGRDILIYGGGDFLFKLIGFAVFPIYTHLFSVENFGLIALIGVSTSLVGLFVNIGVNNSVQRFYWDIGAGREEQAKLVSSGLCQLVIVGVTVIALLIAAIYLLRDDISQQYRIEWTVLVIAVCTVLPDQLLQYALDTVRLHFSPVKFLLISFVKNIVGIAAGLILVVQLHWGLYGIFAGALLSSVVALPIALWMIRSDLRGGVDRATIGKLIQFGYPFVFTGVAYWIFGTMDRWMLDWLSDQVQVGLYSVAFKFAAVIGFVSAAFGQAWSPYAIKLFRDSPTYKEEFSTIFSSWTFVLAFLALGVALFSGEILMLMTPHAYWQAASSLVLVVVGAAIYGTTQLTVIGISLEKKTKLLAWGALFAALINVVFNFLLIPAFGATGAAAATIISYSILTITYLVLTQRLHPIPLQRGKLFYGVLILMIASASVLVEATTFRLPYILAKLLLLILVLAGALQMGMIRRRFISSFLARRV